MHRRWAPLRWLAVIALLLVGGVFSDESASERVEIPEADADAVVSSNGKESKMTRSFVAATHGSAHALTLTTFLTDAAYLHYAVLPAGHEVLDAAGVKTAAAQCRVDVSEETKAVASVDYSAARRLPDSRSAVERVQSAGVVAADTVAVAKSQKVVSSVENLLANTSYDVYFVAEVIGSNGVFGPVQSVLQSWTHPEPPHVGIAAVRPANAVGVDAGAVQPKFALHSVPLQANNSFAFQKVIEKLAPATLYDVYVMTEATGNGEVRSEVIRHANAARTHALAPEVTTLSCSPQNASATALDVSFTLEVDPEDVRRSNNDTLSYFKYDLHYEVIALSDGATRSTDDISALKNTTIRGLFSLRNFSSVEDFQAGSNGLFGLRELTAQAKTHETAPAILAATAQATNKSWWFHCQSSKCIPASDKCEESPAASAFSSKERVGASSDNRSPNPSVNAATSPEKATEDNANEAFRQQFEIKGLNDATSYSIALLPETTKSFGLFGRVFATLLETATNENASEVELLSVKPLHGNVSAVQLEQQAMDGEADQAKADQATSPASDSCQEVEGRERFEFSRSSPNLFTFTVGNLSENTEYRTSAQPTAATTSQVEAQVMVGPDSPCILHYVARESLDSTDAEERKPVDAATIVEHSSEVAPKIVLATVDPVAGSTDSVIISANLSHPGIVHYFLSDVDFADPAIIRHSDSKHTPHELRGEFQVLEEHILMEIINGTNDTRGGVFGEFPPPVLVNTHLGPPIIIPEKLSVHAAPTERTESKDSAEDKGNESIAIWPPPISTFDLTNLNGSMLKAADFEELGVGVWVNDTISVSREDVMRGKLTHKEIDKLPANALFDVCIVSETAASGGILGWPSDGSASACHRVATHADYTNQSVLFDEISVHALSGRTDGIRISLNVSKLLTAPQTTDAARNDALDRFALATGRVPYFLLIDAKARSGRDLAAFSSHRGEVTSAFKTATPGRGDGVVAAGMLADIIAENATALRIEQEVLGLDANHDYLLFFAYETSGSNGVFTNVNPHKHRSNDTRSENDGIPVTTFESAPRIPKAKAQPTFGHTASITVKFDVACDSCKDALIHLLVFPSDCEFPSSVVDTLHLDQLSDSESNTTISATQTNETTEGDCNTPLVQKRVKIDMSERQHTRNDVEEELGGEHVLSANTSYVVLLATETVGSQGVLSKRFEEPLRVRTHAPAPSFTELQLEPRTGSTTELVLTFALDRPGEVHYMIGASDNSEFNVTSPHNISSKGLLDYLVAGTSYDLFIVSEAVPADHGVYGSIHELKDVSTFANAPILLAHAAYPTPGTTQALTVGFRLDAPGIVYFSVVAVKPWAVAEHVAKGSDRFGNRLALEDRLVAQKRLEVDKQSMELESDSGWREQILEVPQTGLNYTLHLVTETKDSGGIYGIVATHAGVRAHPEAPELTNVSVTPTDAHVDALTVNVTLSDRGHVHYIALPSGRGTTPPSDDFSQQSTELSVLASGRVDVNETAGSSQQTSFTITGLTEGTAYDLYFRAETFESFGVYGAWSRQAVTARTHGLPPDVLPEAVECKVTPACDQVGRETCSRKANVCGKCLEGYAIPSDNIGQEVNLPCVKQQPPNKAKRGSRGPTIKINGVKRNPNLHLSEVEPLEELEPEVLHSKPQNQPTLEQQFVEQEEEQHATMDQTTEDTKVQQELRSEQQSVELETGQQTTAEDTVEEPEVHHAITLEEPAEPAIMQPPTEDPIESVVQDAPTQEPLPQEVLGQPELDQQQPQQPIKQDPLAISSQGIINDAPSQHEATSEQESIPEFLEATGCPLNAQRTASGLCECIPGYEADEKDSSCVLSRMTTAAEAATTATAFDILNAHHQVPSQSV
uniref:Fibronectin type-III domain-containing protein n=1 Tax=Phytophthora ramorum TaxID=164328 RepID=H3HDJ8_PHYRM